MCKNEELTIHNKDGIKLIGASINDLNILLDIYNYYLDNTTVTFDFGAITLDEFKTRIYIDHQRYKTFKIYVENEIELAGFCFLTQFRAKPAYYKTVELGLYLKPPYTGKGYGQIIVKLLENIAKQIHFEVIIVSISGEIIPSIKLFSKLGYLQCAHYKSIAQKFGRKMDILDYQKFI